MKVETLAVSFIMACLLLMALNSAGATWLVVNCK
jgi:hypothetical protein